MNIVAIEQTPNPDSMRVVLSTELPAGESYNFTKNEQDKATEPLASVIAIDGIASVYHVMNFIAVQKEPSANWESIVNELKQIIPM